MRQKTTLKLVEELAVLLAVGLGFTAIIVNVFDAFVVS